MFHLTYTYMLLSTANHPSIFTLTHSLARSSVAPFIDSLATLATLIRRFAGQVLRRKRPVHIFKRNVTSKKDVRL